MGFRNPIVLADEVTSGTFAGTYTIGGLMVVGNPNAQHVAIGTDTHGADGLRLYGTDGVTPLIDLNIAGAPTITSAHIRSAATGARVELSSGEAQLIRLFTGDASETAGGFIGTQVVSGQLYTQVASPKAGTSTPPQLQLWDSSTSQAAILNAPAGPVSLQSNSWSATFDGTPSSGPELRLYFANLVMRQNSTSPYMGVLFNDSGNTQRGLIAAAPFNGAWSSGTYANDLVVMQDNGSGVSLVSGGNTARWDGHTFDIGAGNYINGGSHSTWQVVVHLNGWTDYGSDGGGNYAPFRVYEDASGTVHLEGVLKAGTLADGTDIGQLPSGRQPPSYNQVITVIGMPTTGGVVIGRANVFCTGSPNAGHIAIYGLSGMPAGSLVAISAQWSNW